MVRVELLLDLVDPLEKAPSRERHDRPMIETTISKAT